MRNCEILSTSTSVGPDLTPSKRSLAAVCPKKLISNIYFPKDLLIQSKIVSVRLFVHLE